MPEKKIDEKSESQGVAVPETQELVFTVKTATGEITKVEVLKRDGSRQELSEPEYANLASCLTGSMPLENYGYDPYAVFYGQAYATGYGDAYYQGMADYATALASTVGQYPHNPEEIAYYQGMADYAASLG